MILNSTPRAVSPVLIMKTVDRDKYVINGSVFIIIFEASISISEIIIIGKKLIQNFSHKNCFIENGADLMIQKLFPSMLTAGKMNLAASHRAQFVEEFHQARS